jgi:hypothetical protein
MTTTEAERLATGVETANDELVALAESCTPEQWATIVPGEDWTVGVLCHHVAEGHLLVIGWLQAVAEGRDVEDTAEGVNEQNARHAEAFAEVGVPETVDLLRTNGATAASYLRSLSPQQMACSAGFGPAGGTPFTTAQLASAVERHVRGHMESARSALAAAGAQSE